MKFYWNCNTHGRPEKNQPLYCVGLYCNDLEGFMELSTNEENRLDDELIITFIRKYDNIVGKYETSDHIFYGDLDKTIGVFFEFLKD